MESCADTLIRTCESLKYLEQALVLAEPTEFKTAEKAQVGGVQIDSIVAPQLLEQLNKWVTAILDRDLVSMASDDAATGGLWPSYLGCPCMIGLCFS